MLTIYILYISDKTIAVQYSLKRTISPLNNSTFKYFDNEFWYIITVHPLIDDSGNIL